MCNAYKIDLRAVVSVLDLCVISTTPARWRVRRGPLRNSKFLPRLLTDLRSYLPRLTATYFTYYISQLMRIECALARGRIEQMIWLSVAHTTPRAQLIITPGDKSSIFSQYISKSAAAARHLRHSSH